MTKPITYAEAAIKLRDAGYSVTPVLGKLEQIRAHDGCNAIAIPIDRVNEFIDLKPTWRSQRDPDFYIFAGWSAL